MLVAGWLPEMLSLRKYEDQFGKMRARNQSLFEYYLNTV